MIVINIFETKNLDLLPFHTKNILVIPKLDEEKNVGHS